jgi:hypothetical protein
MNTSTDRAAELSHPGRKSWRGARAATMSPTGGELAGAVR